MSAWLVAAAIAVLLAAARRWPVTTWAGAALTLTGALCGAALAAMALAAAGALRPAPLAATWLALATAMGIVPRGATRPSAPDASRRTHLLLAAVVLGGLALRLPTMTFPMGGRDQGTYLLRARHTARTGRLDATDAVLADLGRAPQPGDADVTGLFRVGHEPWREDRYEGPYRPGWYLADLATGHVVPQFFHLQPSLLAAGELAFGPGRGHLWIPAQDLAALLAFAALCLAWLPGAVAVAATALYALSPLAIWTARQTLTEPFAAALLLAAALAARRQEGSPWGVAFFVGTLAFLRGDGWIAAAALLAAWALAALARRPTPGERGAAGFLAAMLLASVVLHATTAYPYVHDELARQLGLHPSPLEISTGAAALVALAGLPHLVDSHAGGWASRSATWLLHHPGPVALALGVVAATTYLLAPGGGRASRLDPLPAALGAPLLLLAAAGALRRLRLRTSTPAAWGLALLVPTTLLLYAPKNLPRAHLYYYGRYLVPVLLPAAILLAADLVAGLARPRPKDGLAGRWPAARKILVGAALLLACAWPSRLLLTAPQTRLQAFEGAEDAMATLATAIPEDAVVFAGGEGWHGGHTFNQVGGGLAFGFGRHVLPYVNDDAAQAAAVHLLLRRPARTGRPPPRVFLLRNEATHARPGPDGPLAVFDDRISPPLVPRAARLFEIVLHRLTPDEALPTRVTRDALRLGLVELAPAPPGTSATRTFPDGKAEGGAPLDAREVAGRRAEGMCLAPDRDVVLTLPGPAEIRDLPNVTAATFGLTPQVADRAGEVRIRVDGRRVPLDPPGRRHRPRATLGPVPVSAGNEIALRGTRAPSPQAPCPHGGLARLDLLGPSAHALPVAAPPERLGAPDDLGVPIPPTTWVAGRGLSGARPLRTNARRAGLSFAMTPGTFLDFGPQELPTVGVPLALSVTLVGSRAGPDARIELLADGAPIATFTPPGSRRGTWLAPPVSWTPSVPTPALRLVFHAEGPDREIRLRDVAIYVPPNHVEATAPGPPAPAGVPSPP